VSFSTFLSETFFKDNYISIMMSGFVEKFFDLKILGIFFMNQGIIIRELIQKLDFGPVHSLIIMDKYAEIIN
jgi:hypothetical protein